MSCSSRHCTIIIPSIVSFRGKNNNVFFANRVIFTKGFAIAFFAACLPLILLSQNPIFVMPVNGTISLNTLINCDSTFSFISDTTNNHLYTDNAPRSDTMSICPPSQRQRVCVTFSAFDLAAGDTLFAFDGKIPRQNIFIGSGSGVGPTKAFGAWVGATCTPDTNLLGCISFIFKTNGDNIKSTGWKASVKCKDRNIQIQSPSIPTSKRNCSPLYEIVTIPAAMITSDCDTIINDSTFVRIFNTAGILCIDTCLSKNQNMSFADTFAFGNYIVEYKWKLDSSIQKRVFFSVNAPFMACNDTLNVAIDALCKTQITPDLLLENPCESIGDTLLYQITIKEKAGKTLGGRVIASGTGRAGDFPIITKDMINFCGKVFYTAEIKQVIYDSLSLSICNNGPQFNSCWVILRFEDKVPPLFLDPVQCDTIYACEVEMTPAALGLATPRVSDNCDSTKVMYAGAQLLSTPTDCDTLQTYLITWRANDECGNTSERKDTVKVFRPGIDKIIKAPTIILSCGEDDSTAIHDLNKVGVPQIQIGRQKNGVFIPGDTLQLTGDLARICNYNIDKRDVRVAVDCNHKYYRYWQLLDWCSQSTRPINIDTQLIEFRDTLAPVINCPNHSTLATAQKIALSGQTCQLKVNFPLPTATDKCVATPTVKEFTVDLLENGAWWSVATSLEAAGALECDTFRVGYRAFDDCHSLQPKEDTCYHYFILEDVTAPTAICRDELLISLSMDSTRIYADAIDGGSWDMCEIDTILARRTVCNDVSTYQGTDNQYVTNRLSNGIDAKGWSNILTFSCCDLHHPVFVELLVIDKKGNHNKCWMEVKTEDKISPICQRLDTITVFCDEYNDSELGSETDINDNNDFDDNEWIPLVGDLETFYNTNFGNPALKCEDNLTCANLIMEQAYQLIKKSCGEIIIKRRYRVIDYGKNQSAWETQIINLEYRANWKITFPIDQSGDCDSRLNPPAEIPIQNGNCDQLSWDYEEEIFKSSNNVFVKVLRTYSIINWCNYQPGDKPLIIKRKENFRGVVTNPQMISSDSFVNASFIQYTQLLYVVDEEAPFLFIGKVDTVIIGKGDEIPLGIADQTPGAAPFECDAVKVFQVFARDCNEATSESLKYIWEFLMNGEIMATGEGDTFSQIVYPGPHYEVKWVVTDLFTNSSLIAEHYTFVDGLAPVAYCTNGIVAEATPGNRFVTVNTDMFDRGSYDNCTISENLKRRLWHPVLNVPRPKTMVEVMALPDFLQLGCLFIGTQEISLYVMDEAGNFDYCTTELIIQNNMLSCSRRIVSGNIVNQKGEAIESVEVKVESVDNNLSIMSNSHGGFEFTMPEGADYTVRPTKDINPLNGVTTYDLVLMSQHILGIKKFDSPYQYIAADVNNSHTITAFDLVQVRQLILNIIDHFPNNTSWRFIDMDYEFAAEEAAMSMTNINEEINIHNLSGDRLGTDFLGIKIADVNGSAIPNRSSGARGRTHPEKFTLVVDNQEIIKGKTYSIPFYGKDFEQINGYQFTLNFHDLILMNIEGGVASLEHFGRNKEAQGILSTNWYSILSHEKGSTLFTLTFQAIADGTLNELLKITSEYTPAEAYRFSGTFLGVELEFRDPSPIPFHVYQNTPNPFNSNTIIPFDLPSNGNVVFQLVNSQGQIVKKQETNFQRGYNEIKLSIKNLPNGTYYYQLVTPFGVETKKMTKM